jgi:3-deoxy-manno-octulosonate cytidylyltransferase (CMP-KDO synthetase)
MNFIGIIPARYQSSRFPGKPLAMIHDKPMIQWVYERSADVLENVWVATDNKDIFSVVESFGGQAILTSPHHPSGTDRCAEAARLLSDSIHFDVVINIQGDEPFIQPVQIERLMRCFGPGVEIATLARKITNREELDDRHKPKVVFGENGLALYFSRAAIPFAQSVENEHRLDVADYWAHIGLYGYRADILQKITALKPGRLEKTESLEQLRWLENGFRINVAETDYQSFGIDTPEDLERGLKLFSP